MSSTTDTRGDRGQVIVIFGLSIFTIVVIAALAFDTGMMLLERRDQQNAADAAALAGARYLINEPLYAYDGARDIATTNGFTHGVDNSLVQVNIPPLSGQFKGFAGFVEVIISSERSSIFGGVVGAAGWDVSSRAVAANQQGLDLPFSMLSIHPTACAALKVSGTGVVNSAGSVQVNSECGVNALDVGGSGVLTVTADGAVCNAAGGIDEHGANADLNCTQVPNSYAIPDPLKTLPAPPVPPYPQAIERAVANSKAIPPGCPGSSIPATATTPAPCQFTGAYEGTYWRLFPGYYPGGIESGKANLYLEPGIYYIGGGGFRAANGDVNSVAIGGTAPPHGGGVLLYNTEAYEFHDECADGTAPAPDIQCIQPIVLNGGTSGVNLLPLDDGSLWDGMVIFQDRTLNVSRENPALTDVQINGGGSLMEIAGTIYVPYGDVVVNGSEGELVLDQVIAYTFQINGNGGQINILYRDGVSARISGVGLVE